MGRPIKPMAKNSNSRFTTRNNKQDIFSKFTKAVKPKEELEEKPEAVRKSVEPSEPSEKGSN